MAGRAGADKSELGKFVKNTYRPPENRQQPYAKSSTLKSPRRLTKKHTAQFSSSNTGIPRCSDDQKRRTEVEEKDPNEAVRHSSHKSPPGSLVRGKSYTNEDLSKPLGVNSLGDKVREMEKVLTKTAKELVNPPKEPINPPKEPINLPKETVNPPNACEPTKRTRNPTTATANYSECRHG